MNKLILHAATAAILGLATASAIAQTQSTTSTTYVQSSAVLGSKIRDARGEDVGVIKDFVLDRNTGCLAYVVLSTGKGGVLSSESKTVAAPAPVFSASSAPKVYVTRIEGEKIYSAPVWESTRVDEYTRTDYLNNVYSYCGVPAPHFAEMSVGASNTTTTGVTSATNATGVTSSNATSSMSSPSAATPASSPLGTPERTAAPRMTPYSSPKMPPSTHTPARQKETSSPSMRSEPGNEKKSAEERTEKSGEERAKKSERGSESMEPNAEKSERTETQGKSSESKKRHGREPASAPETESTPR